MMKAPDVDINTSDTSTSTHNQISGLITRARVCQLNNQVFSFLASYSSYLDNGNMYSVLLLRNDGQEQNRVVFVVFSSSTLHIHLAIQCLFYLFLLVLRLLAGQMPSWLGCHAPQDHVDYGSWCIGR
jgi:hypothetical protein